ncbi:biotin-dependent carboxyltransferase family protein [Bacillus sp. SD088]|uniref:5-oxoprolinase subunit C family protein n=1 Tax=Bacillus sp. SD088 TaxID=2782012 RepID=UPI001A97043F|nr:biotin-dependent carboxyltransferase family protein [Bacillus sp. SD088]MBO0993919.1 biotin-dependent carboxyltransferase family protein [Bacillus sp. SD088]
MSLYVIKPGMQTTIQDFGRHGWQSLGVSVCGAMDPWAARIANILLNNHENEAVLEMTVHGPTLEIQEDLFLAIFGANMDVTRNGKKLAQGKPVFVQKGDILTFGYAKTGMRTYLAVKGGFPLQKVLHSYSTDLKAKIGGLNGRALKEGDILPSKSEVPSLAPDWGFPYHINNHYINKNCSPIHFIRGRHYHWFKKESLQVFESSFFTIKPDSNRMGYRLSGPALEWEESRELITEATTFGSIQIPPSGQPIILMADRQPTGGYPKIGEVIQSDLPRLSQMRPGQKLYFQEITLQEAYQKTHKQHQTLEKVKIACRMKWQEMS